MANNSALKAKAEEFEYEWIKQSAVDPSNSAYVCGFLKACELHAGLVEALEMVAVEGNRRGSSLTQELIARGALKNFRKECGE